MHCHDVDCFMHTFLLCRCMWWYAYHACLCHPLALYASLHACLHVHTWILLASVLSILQHNEAMDIWSRPTLVACGHHLLFAFLLLCLPCLSCLSVLCLFICFLYLFLPLLFCWLLIFAFACTHMERGRLELGYSLPNASKKGTDASMSMWLSQAVVFSRFRSLAFPFGYVLF